MHQTEEPIYCHFCGLETHEPRMNQSGQVYCPDCIGQAHPELHLCDACHLRAGVAMIGMMVLCQECIERGTKAAVFRMAEQALASLPQAHHPDQCPQCGDTRACRHKRAAAIMVVAQLGNELRPEERGLVRELFAREDAA